MFTSLFVSVHHPAYCRGPTILELPPWLAFHADKKNSGTAGIPNRNPAKPEKKTTIITPPSKKNGKVRVLLKLNLHRHWQVAVKVRIIRNYSNMLKILSLHQHNALEV
jgi:hypothetical protein